MSAVSFSSENSCPLIEDVIGDNVTERTHTLLEKKMEVFVLEAICGIANNSRLPTFVRFVVDPQGILQRKETSFSNKNCRRTVAVMVAVLTRAYGLLKMGKTITTRDLYYEDVPLFGNQLRVSKAIHDLAVYFQVPPSAFPFVASPKGLMAAGKNMELKRKIPGQANKLADVSVEKSGSLIPRLPIIQEWGKFVSNAEFILIVEKDAIFYRLLEDNVFKYFNPFIMLTGKGYPDRGTRALASKLSRELEIPTFVLVDADPYGLEIAAIYKWGSQSTQRFFDENNSMIVPNLSLIGILPSELNSFDLPQNSKLPFTLRDSAKLSSLITRLNAYEDNYLLREADALKDLDFKAEIEAVAIAGSNYFCDVYLRSKIVPYMRRCKLSPMDVSD